MTERDHQLARFLTLYTDAAEAGGVRDFGFLREAGRRLLELSEDVEPGVKTGRCRGCGAELVQAATGRPRQWCGRGVCAAQRAKKTPENAILAVHG